MVDHDGNDYSSVLNTESCLDILEEMIFISSENVMLLLSGSNDHCHRSSSVSSNDSTKEERHRHTSRSNSLSNFENRYSYE